MASELCAGIVGLGVMGQALALNLAERGVRVVGFDAASERLDVAMASRIATALGLDELLRALESPRRILLVVPAGTAVERLVDELGARLAPGDLVVDAGNSHFRDTQRRAGALEARGIHYLGVGVSGGEQGARHGPCVMAGGSAGGWQLAEPLLGAAAARVDGEPCAAWLGGDGAGHFVKMVHNGIEYAEMQLIGEVRALLNRACGLDDAAVANLFASWNHGPLESYLLEITVEVLRISDPHTHRPMVELIRDVTGHKGTGRWAAVEAVELGATAPTLLEAVCARAVSARWAARQRLEQSRDAPAVRLGRDDAEALAPQLESALLAGRLAVFAQGFDLLRAGSEHHGWSLPLDEIARIWRGGCIIRARVLEMVRAACADGLDDAGLLGHPDFARAMAARTAGLRHAVATAAQMGAASPCLASCLAWYDGMHSARSSAALLQAQRDFFGRHGFERLDREGRFHLDGSEA